MADTVHKASSSQSSTSNPIPKCSYHVFLNFRGEDTRKGFIDHLYAALSMKGIIAFRDDEEFEQGDAISQKLLQAIEDSHFAIVVLSKNYASSSWCLDELQKIIASRKELGQQVLPIFYGVDPFDVRHQKGSFAQAFIKHAERFGEDKEKVQKWRDSLTEVANLSGWVSKDKPEAKLIEEVVETLGIKLHSTLPPYNDDMTIYNLHTKPKDQNPTPMAPSVQRKWKFHVFLSFIGQDTRMKFTHHLYSAFRERGMIVFKEDTEVEREQNTSPHPEIFEAIEDSLYVIVVLSKNYASSAWCLDELQKALESRKKLGRQVSPIFYGVDPSEVRNQDGSFAKAFARHEAIFERDKVQRWRIALTEIADLSGWDSKLRNESELVEDIVGSTWNKLLSETPDLISSWDSKHQKEEPTNFVDVKKVEAKLATRDPNKVIGIDSWVASSYLDDLVGIRSRVDEIVSYLEIDSDDVRFIGIWGIGGIGKTTLGRVVYDKISNLFPYHYFYNNVSKALRRNGQVGLQRVLLSCLQKSRGSLRIHNTEEGKNILKRFFKEKKVLIVLDDVNDTSQLKNLVETPEWFGGGSRIIITTRDMSLLRLHGVPYIYYKIKALNDDESLQLFSRNAFKRDYPDKNFFSLSQSVVQYAGGLPLALQVLGSFLFQRSIPQWREALVHWKQHPHERILKTLKISYEELTEENKRIFLHIACFLAGWENDRIIQELKNYDFDDQTIEHGLRVLIAKALIIEEENCLEMHSLLQQLGRSIVLEGGPELLLQRYTNVWRIVGFVSSMVAVVTYAGSSSFNLLWGEWKWWTILLYCLFSFIVCGVMSIAPKLSQLQVLRRSWAKHLLTFMILMLTFSYSFYYDKYMTKKPDALSLISSSTFALMLLSLSKQIELGFELGVCFFWLGHMMQQLMKINFILVLVAAVVCSIFLVFHSNCKSSGAVNENNTWRKFLKLVTEERWKKKIVMFSVYS